MTVPELHERWEDGPPLQVLDVRELSEWESGHIPGAVHTPYHDIHALPEGIDADVPVAVICASGQRAAVGASLLARHGAREVIHVVDGGVGAWGRRAGRWRRAADDPHGRRRAVRTSYALAMSAATTPSTRLLDNYIGGQWTPAHAATGELDVTNPATGEVLARVPLSGAADLDAAVARGARGAARVARGLDDRPRAQAVRAARAAGGAQRGPRALGDHRDGQDDRRRPRRGGADDRDGRGRVRDPDDDAGPRSSRTSRATSTPRRSASRSACARRSCPFNFPAMVPFWFLPFAIALRQHVRAQALRAGAADAADRLRGARRARAAARRRQPRQRRPRGRRGRSSTTRASTPSRSSARRRWRGSSTSARPRPASACRRSAAPRTTWS